MTLSQLDSDLDRLACLAGRSRRVSELPGGLTNHNVRVRTGDGGDFVVRCSTGDVALLGIDRDAEHHNTRRAAEAGVGARVVEYRPDLRMLVIEHLPGAVLDNGSFADERVLGRAAQAVRALHAGSRFAGDFDMFARQATYLATVKSNGFRLPSSYDDLAEDWETVRRAVAVARRPTVPCNNDLLAANFIDDGTRVWLIDYEYSGNNDAAFELGNTATECDFDADLVEAWTAAYFGDPTPADLARVRVQALCSAYGWSLWGFIQAATSPLDFDFFAWGAQRLDKAAAVFRGPDLPRLLDQVAAGG
ncbi:choline kinase family protein [Nocardioides sp. cx-173]|uniref:choline kinase family protein n=1 Tax=Nocardioides sp. cx-173 TaxID=2898796 RepID=UPI001E5A2E7D|nr:phosphotransferase [Nocardioides sp. cx-173]MCD4525812.1 choline kinase family protein [Nocardioides sp. cx-173]UGB39967.1 choline kinase family protein [Nocardioides sp. cx-173]